MKTDTNRVFYFHAGANATGGFLTEPSRINIPTLASASLSPAGGSVAPPKSTERLHLEDVLTCEEGSVSVDGSQNEAGDEWTTTVNAAAEGIDLQGGITANSLLANLVVKHSPAKNYQPQFCFSGTAFLGLKLNGNEIGLELNPRLLPNSVRKTASYNKGESDAPKIEWRGLWEIARRQAVEYDKPEVPQWLRERYGWMAKPGAIEKVGYALCSLIDRIDLGSETGAQSYGHCVTVPGVGNFFFGEIAVFPDSAQLTMARVELNTSIGKLAKQKTAGGATGVSGEATVAMVASNGSTYPPKVPTP